jgi:Mn-dependent DtxR family transcriptional regulator
MTDATEETTGVRYPDCEVVLLGTSVEAPLIIMRVQRGLKRYLVDEAGMTREEAEAEAEKFSEEARSGDYDNVLMTCHRWVSVS